MPEIDGAYRVELAGADTEITFVEGAAADSKQRFFATLEEAKDDAGNHLRDQLKRIPGRLEDVEALGEEDIEQRVAEPPDAEPPDAEPPDADSPDEAASGIGGYYHLIYEDVDTRIHFWDDSEPRGEDDYDTFEEAKTVAVEYLKLCIEEGGFHEEVKEELPAALARIKALEESEVPR